LGYDGEAGAVLNWDCHRSTDDESINLKVKKSVRLGQFSEAKKPNLKKPNLAIQRKSG
jgi:hypothetical protein